MKNEVEIAINRKKSLELFNTEARKFTGHLFAEIVKKGLEREGFRVSNRDVFIQNVKYEIDLLILKKEAKEYMDLIYSPDDVLFALELKANGSYGEGTINGVKRAFDDIKQLKKNVKCVYLTYTERMNYKHRVTKKKIGYDYEIFELFPREKGDLIEELTKVVNGNWQKFIDYLKNHK